MTGDETVAETGVLREKRRISVREVPSRYETLVKNAKRLAKMMQESQGGASEAEALEKQRVAVMDACADFLSIRTDEEVRLVSMEEIRGAGRVGWSREQ